MLARTPAELANTIRMERAAFDGCFLIVEGTDDRLFAERFVDRGRCRITVAYGKDRVCETIQILDSAGFRGHLGLIDRDCEVLGIGGTYAGTNSVSPDGRDLESLLLNSLALDRVVAEFGSPEKLPKYDGLVRQLLTRAAMPLGWLRYISIRDELNLRFAGLDLSSFIDRRTLAVDRDELTRLVSARSQTVSQAELLEHLAHIPAPTMDYCRGLDLVEVLSVAFR